MPEAVLVFLFTVSCIAIAAGAISYEAKTAIASIDISGLSSPDE